MKRHIKRNILIYPVVFWALLMMSSCQEDDYTLDDLISPKNLSLNFEVVGTDEANPFGDGSGLVNFTASADDEITFVYTFGDGKDKKVAADGKVTHQFSVNGVNKYLVTVMAIGSGGITTSKTTEVEVLSSFKDDEAVEFLTGGTSKNWYWAADQPGHVGLGPNFVDGTNHTWAQWYNAAPFEKTCMYDAEFVFTKTDNGMTFEQTTGPAFIPGTYAAKIGVGADACYGEDVVPSLYGVKNVSFSPSASIATIDGGYRGTTMSFSDGGFMCWYVGSSTFEIIEVTENILKVRIEEDETYAWYLSFTTEKPQ